MASWNHNRARDRAEALLRELTKGLLNVKVVPTWRWCNGETLEALGDGTCFQLDGHDFRHVRDQVQAAIAEKKIHRDSVRIFEDDATLVARAPDCVACGQPREAHVEPNAKCPFAATRFSDDA